MITLQNHVDFLLKFTVAFGAVFELPLLITLLTRMGVVNDEDARQEPQVRDPGCLRRQRGPDADSRHLQSDADGGPAYPALRGRYSLARLFGAPADQALIRIVEWPAAVRSASAGGVPGHPRRADGTSTMMDFSALRPAGAGHAGYPASGIRDHHTHPGGGPPPRPQGQGRGWPVPDRHRKDGCLPHRRLHAVAPIPEALLRVRAPRRACSSSLPPGSWSCRSRQMRTFSARSRHSGPWPCTAASTTTSSATRSPPARTSWWVLPGASSTT